MDALAYDTLSKMNLPHVRLIRLEDLEKGNAPLLEAKSNRSLIEYYFTCTPSLIYHILHSQDEVDLITYLDADLFFFASPDPIFEEFGQSSILIIGHRFPPHLLDLQEFGIYNVGLISFRRDESGIKCLSSWKEDCIEWCYDRIEGDRFADQKYLDKWPNRYSGVCVLQHKGVGLAPWNIDGYRLSMNGDKVIVDDQPLILYHFHNLKMIREDIYELGITKYKAKSSYILRNRIYSEYIKWLKYASFEISNFYDCQRARVASIRHKRAALPLGYKNFFSRRTARDVVNLSKKVLIGDILWVNGMHRFNGKNKPEL